MMAFDALVWTISPFSVASDLCHSDRSDHLRSNVINRKANMETESPPAAKPALVNSDFLLKQLAERLKAKPPELQQRVTAHIRERTGHSTIVSFHNNGATEAEKVEVYSECLRAVLTGDFSPLKGQIAAGQVTAEPKPEPKPVSRDDLAAEEPVTPQPAQSTPNPVGQVTADPKIAAAIQVLMGALGPQSPPIDEAQVRQIVTGIVGERMKEIRSEAMSRVEEYIQKIPPREVVEIRKWDGTVTEIKERCHKQLPLLVKLLASRNAQGWSEFLYVWGAPGAGKTYLLKQLAKALGVKAYPFPCGPTATEGKMLGFNNIANGTFVQGWLYPAYKNGGLVGLDEIALSDGSVMAANNSIENDTFTFGNGEIVERHKDFYLVAFDNTLGTGASGGFVRNRLDAATLNRFTIVKLEYDAELERTVYGDAKWAEYVLRVRTYVEKNCNGSFHITPRATRKGAAYLANGVPPEAVCDMVLFGLCSKDIKETILKNVGPYKP
jgi:AAA domain (dynein-related subfamily)